MAVLTPTSTRGEFVSRIGMARGGPHRFGFPVISIVLAETDPEATPSSFTPLFSVLSRLPVIATLETGPRSALTAGQHVSDGVVVTLSRISMPSMSPARGAPQPGPA